MRVCQFRHYGNGEIRSAGKAEHRNRELLVFQKGQSLSIHCSLLDLLQILRVYIM
jgi:hypothetical protein